MNIAAVTAVGFTFSELAKLSGRNAYLASSKESREGKLGASESENRYAYSPKSRIILRQVLVQEIPIELYNSVFQRVFQLLDKATLVYAPKIY
jgi:hypothetical protein